MLETSHVEYHEAGDPSYTTLDAYAHFDTRGARTGISLDLGASDPPPGEPAPGDTTLAGRITVRCGAA